MWRRKVRGWLSKPPPVPSLAVFSSAYPSHQYGWQSQHSPGILRAWEADKQSEEKKWRQRNAEQNNGPTRPARRKPGFGTLFCNGGSVCCEWCRCRLRWLVANLVATSALLVNSTAKLGFIRQMCVPVFHLCFTLLSNCHADSRRKHCLVSPTISLAAIHQCYCNTRCDFIRED